MTTYLDNYHAALSHDRLKIALRNSARLVLTEQLKSLIPYLEMVAQGDTHILATTGYDLRKDLVRGGSADILAAPEAFRVAHNVGLTIKPLTQPTRLFLGSISWGSDHVLSKMR